nr:retrovirus-related Pol polyprotein from transposon TNT 1-94 [Tanacetum cinerariifolium]
MTFIETARTMLAGSFLPTTFWAEAVNTACYVLNRVLVTKPQNKTPYEVLTSKEPIISYLRPFGCHVTILNTINQLGKFDGKSNSGVLVRCSLNSKAFWVYNLETMRVEENLHVIFLENKPNVAGKGHEWMFDLDYLTNSMNYEPVLVENQANKSTGDKIEKNISFKTCEKPVSQVEQVFLKELEKLKSTPISIAGPSNAFNDGELSYLDPSKYALLDDPSMPHLEDIYVSPSEGIFTNSSYDDEDLPFGKKAIGTKWVYRNKKDERGVVVRNKARLVAQGHRQEEGIDYDEVFALVARIKAIRIFLAFASYMGFVVYQMDVKSAFMYGIIDEQVYVSQPLGFVDPKFPNKVYKVVKALYGLHQASRAWYATLSTFLKKSRYRRGAIDETLFIKQDKKDIMLVQVYVDDIIFGYTKKSWSSRKKMTASTHIETQKPLVKDEEATDVDVHLYRSMIGSLMYLTALATLVKERLIEKLASLKQTALGKDISNPLMAGRLPKTTLPTRYRRGAIDEALFIKQDKKDIMLVQVYVDDIIFGYTKKSWSSRKKMTASTPIETQKPLVQDEEATDVDVHLYRSMIGSLMYLTALVSSFDLEAYSDSDYDGANLDRKSTIEATLVKGRLIEKLASLKQTALGKDISNPLMAGRLPKTTLPTSSVRYALTASPTIRTSCINQFWTTSKVKTINDEVRIQALFDEKRVNIKESFIRCTLKLDDAEGTSCLANAEIFDGLAKIGYEKLSEKLTFYKAFFSPQWKFLIHTILQCLSAKTTSWNDFSSTMASTIICLATNQKFNFSRYILLSLVKNIEAGVPFFMFLRFVQLLIDHQLGDMSHHKDIYDNPSLTKKVFANIKRVGTGFSGVVTAFFDNMLVPAIEEVGLIQDDVQSAPIPTKPSTSKPYKKQKPNKQQSQAPKVPSHEPSPEHRLSSPSNDSLPSGKEGMKLIELMDLCTHFSNKVLELESEVIDIKSTFKERIDMLKGIVERLEEENRVLKDLHSVHSKADTAAPVVEKEKSFKQGRIIVDLDEDVEINLEEAQPNPYRMDLEHQEKVLIDDEEPAQVEKVIEVVKAAKLMTQVVITTRAPTTAEATKGMTYSEIRPPFKKHYNYNQAFLKEVNEEVTVPEKEVEVKAHKREGKRLEKEITKKQKMDEEAEELKSHL